MKIAVNGDEHQSDQERGGLKCLGGIGFLSLQISGDLRLQFVILSSYKLSIKTFNKV